MRTNSAAKSTKVCLKFLAILVLFGLGPVTRAGVPSSPTPPTRPRAVSATSTNGGSQSILPLYREQWPRPVEDTGHRAASDAVASQIAFEQRLVSEVNAIRADNNLPPVKRSPSLDLAAQYHAMDMALDDYFDHDSYDRNGDALLKACDWSLRVQSFYPDWSALAENIAAGHSTPESVMNAWMNSAAHRDSILSEGYWEIGVGFYSGTGLYNQYWVQDFGRRTNQYPLIINGEASETASRDVSLYIYGDWREMRLRNDEDTWPAWRPFEATPAWTVGGGAGLHTVWVELRAEGKTAISSDTIYLADAPTLGGLSDSVQFTYMISSDELIPLVHEEPVLNVTTQDALSWSASAEGGWFEFAPNAGTTPGLLSITPTRFATDGPAVYTGAITVTVTDPMNTRNTPRRIDLVLQVRPQPAALFWLPLVLTD